MGWKDQFWGRHSRSYYPKDILHSTVRRLTALFQKIAFDLVMRWIVRFINRTSVDRIDSSNDLASFDDRKKIMISLTFTQTHGKRPFPPFDALVLLCKIEMHGPGQFDTVAKI